MPLGPEAVIGRGLERDRPGSGRGAGHVAVSVSNNQRYSVNVGNLTIFM